MTDAGSGRVPEGIAGVPMAFILVMLIVRIVDAGSSQWRCSAPVRRPVLPLDRSGRKWQWWRHGSNPKVGRSRSENRSAATMSRGARGRLPRVVSLGGGEMLEAVTGLRRWSIGAAGAALLVAAIVWLAVRGGGATHPVNVATGPVVAAQDLIGSMGINVHLGYLDTSYARFAGIEARLKGLGIGLVRDGACARCSVESQRLRQLAAAGIKADLIMGSPTGQFGSLSQLLGLVRGPLRPSAVSVEGPNEYDTSGDPDWRGHLRSYQRQLYTGVKADPRLHDIPVIAPSLARPQSYGLLGDLSKTTDAGNIHSYPPWGEPSDVNLAAEVGLAGLVTPGKPVLATETGYRTAGPFFPFNTPVSERVEAAYLPALYLEYFRAGIVRTFAYELADEKPDPSGRDPEQHFGLLRYDLSPKPAYLALRNLITVLGTGGSSHGPLGVADVHITSLDGDFVHALVAQRGDGAQVLALWPAPPYAGPPTRVALVPRRLVLTLPRPASVELYRPAVGPSPLARYRRASRVAVSLGGDLLLAVLHPAGEPL